MLLIVFVTRLVTASQLTECGMIGLMAFTRAVVTHDNFLNSDACYHMPSASLRRS